MHIAPRRGKGRASWGECLAIPRAARGTTVGVVRLSRVYVCLKERSMKAVVRGGRRLVMVAAVGMGWWVAAGACGRRRAGTHQDGGGWLTADIITE